MIKVHWVIDIGYPTAVHRGYWKFPDDEFDHMTEQQRNEALDEMLMEEYHNRSYSTWTIED